MSTVASTLLDFILDLFRDPGKAAAYEADPQGALDTAGLSDATPDQVADLMPMVADYATVTNWGGHGGGVPGSGSREAHRGDERGPGREDEECDAGGSGGGTPVPGDDDECGVEESGRPVRADDDTEDHGHSGGGGSPSALASAGGTETVVITHLQEVHHSSTEITVEIDASHSIWVSGDAQAIFGDVDGDVTRIDNQGGIVAGEDVENSAVDNSDTSVAGSFNTDVEVRNDDLVVTEGSGNTVVTDAADVGNTDVRVEDVDVESGDGDLVEDSADVGNDASVRLEDSLNSDDSVADSFNGSDLSDDDGVDDSFDGSLNGSDLSDDDTKVVDVVETHPEVEDSGNSDDDLLDLADTAVAIGEDTGAEVDA